MANKVKGEQVIHVGDRTYTLYYDMNALAELEGELGMKVVEIEQMFKKGISGVGINELRAIFWAGLLHRYEDPDDYLTIREAGKIFTEAAQEDFDGVVEAIGESFASAFGDGGKAKKKTQTKKK